MALQLPPNFKKDIQGRDTALVPVVTISTDVAPIRISTNSITIDGNNFKPILLNIPSLKESIDIEKRNYKISSINIDISNLSYEGKRFSELVGVTSLINADCDIFWTSPSANTLNPSSDSRILPIYHGTIRRYTHDTEKVKLVVEDRSQATLHQDLPTTSLGTGDDVPDKYKNKPIPMVYGHVDRSPCVVLEGKSFTLSPDTESKIPEFSYNTSTNTIWTDVVESSLYIYKDGHYINVDTSQVKTDSNYIEFISGSSQLLNNDQLFCRIFYKPEKIFIYQNSDGDPYNTIIGSGDDIGNMIDGDIGTEDNFAMAGSISSGTFVAGLLYKSTHGIGFEDRQIAINTFGLSTHTIEDGEEIPIDYPMLFRTYSAINNIKLPLHESKTINDGIGVYYFYAESSDFNTNPIIEGSDGLLYDLSGLLGFVNDNSDIIAEANANCRYAISTGILSYPNAHSIEVIIDNTSGGEYAINAKIKEIDLRSEFVISKIYDQDFYANVNGRTDPVSARNRSTREVFNITGFGTEGDDDFEEVKPPTSSGSGIYEPFEIDCGVRWVDSFDHHRGYCTDGDTFHYIVDTQHWDGQRQIKIEKWNWDFTEKLAIRGDIRPVAANGYSDLPIQVEGDQIGNTVSWGTNDADIYPSSYSHPITKHAYPTPININTSLVQVNHMGDCCFLSGTFNMIIAGLQRYDGTVSNAWGSPQLIVFDADDLSVINVSNLHGEETGNDPELASYAPSHLASAVAADVERGYLYVFTYSDANNQDALPTDRTPVYELGSITEDNQYDPGRLNFISYYDHELAAEQEGNANPHSTGRITEIRGAKYYNGFLYITSKWGYIFKLEIDHDNQKMIIRGVWYLSSPGTQGFDFYKNSDGNFRLRVLNNKSGGSTYGAASTLYDYGVEGNWEGGGDVVEGCTDPDADNHNPDATVDDGSCEYHGCTNETACNYDEDANVDDGSCYYGTLCSDGGYECDSSDCPEEPDDSVGGCKDPSACNYDEDATFDDGSCAYESDCFGECGGDAVVDECGVCGGDNSSCDPPDPEEGTYTEIGGLIQKPSDIAYHLMDVELNGGVLSDKKNYSDKSSIEVSREVHSAWNLGFTISKKINSKKLLEGLLASSKSFIRYNSMGEYGFVTLKDFNSSLEHDLLIMNDDIISFAYDRTKIEDVASSVIVEYNKDYARDEYVKLDPKNTGFASANMEDYRTEYYGLEEDHSESEKTFSSDYIRDSFVAGKWQDFLLKWYCNQHLLIFVDLPLKYINIEVGDIVIFDKAVDVLPYGIDYAKDNTLEQVNGQEVYPQFLIYETNKQIDKISVKCIQMHELNRNGDWNSNPNEVFGCTDINACNYDEDATKDDGNCEYEGCDDPDVAGCTDNTPGSYPDVNEEGAYLACNYNPDANVDDDSCMYDGCSDPDANNYIGEVCNDDGSCTYDCATGDANCDGGWNVLDIVTLASCIVYPSIECPPQGDMNGDGGYNVLDIVTLAQCVLNNTCEG